MKSVKITDCDGRVLVKVIKRKNGRYDSSVLTDIADKITMEIREENGRKIMFYPEAKK